MATLVEEVGGQRPDRVRAQTATLGVRPQEEVDPGAPEIGLVLLDGLDVADDLAGVLDDERDLLGVTDDQLRDDAVEVEVAPPARDLGLGQDRGEDRRIGRRGRSEGDLVAAQLHRPSLPQRPG